MNDDPNRRTPRATLWLFLAVLLSPVVVRALLIAEFGLDLLPGDLRGVFLDVAVSFLLTLGIQPLMSRGRPARFAGAAVLVVWCLINFANYEHIRELGSMARLTYVGFVADPTFFFGSVMAPSHPLLLLVVVVVTTAVALAVSSDEWVFMPKTFVAGAFLLVFAAVVVPASPRIAAWRSSNFLVSQANALRSLSAPNMRGPAGPRAGRAPVPKGDPIIEPSPRGSNVMLVILEGVSGSYLPTVRARHGSECAITMPELDAVANRGMTWSTFINQQRQTNRGEYALLCGDYPKLGPGEPKMTELIEAGALDCLPRVLGAEGYETVYLQAAPMSFMMKEQFMPLAGFDTAVGDASYEMSYSRNQWGVDDRAFFEQSLDKIERLEAQSKPWFLTLLTAGTHHPFNVPADHESDHEPGTPAHAMEYLDRSFGAFFRDIEARGLLSNTLVLITSDESREQRPGQSDVETVLAQAWGFLIAVAPSGEVMVVDEPAMQLDLPSSVLDYLGLAESAGSFGGRSVFRRYDEPRQMMWGNTHLHRAGGLSSSGDLVICDWSFRHCFGTRLDGRTLFSTGLGFVPSEAAETEWLREGVAASAASWLVDPRVRNLDLVPARTTPLNTEAPKQYIAAGQFLTIPGDTLAEVEIEIRLEGRAGGRVQFFHDLILNRRQEYLRTTPLRVGETVRLRYWFLSTDQLGGVELRIWVESVTGTGLEIVSRSASLRLSPLGSQNRPYGLMEELFSVGD